MTGTVHHQIGAKAADDIADILNADFRRLDFVDIHRGFGAEFARERKARRLRRAHADDPTCAHLLRRRDRQIPIGPEP